VTLALFAGEVSPSAVADVLDAHHYLGRTGRGWAWSDARGVVVLGPPTSRMLPRDWLELSRWCLIGGKNDGSQQWADLRRHILATRPDVTTVVSYSDPSAGHDGALYRACGWVWAPTWHRLRPPPTQGGSWDGVRVQATKDRWAALLRPDERRAKHLRVNDKSIMSRFPWLEWREPKARRGVCIPNSGGVDRKRWISEVAA
jgi:hypothetical protein